MKTALRTTLSPAFKVTLFLVVSSLTLAHTLRAQDSTLNVLAPSFWGVPPDTLEEGVIEDIMLHLQAVHSKPSKAPKQLIHRTFVTLKTIEGTKHRGRLHWADSTTLLLGEDSIALNQLAWVQRTNFAQYIVIGGILIPSVGLVGIAILWSQVSTDRLGPALFGLGGALGLVAGGTLLLIIDTAHPKIRHSRGWNFRAVPPDIPTIAR